MRNGTYEPRKCSGCGATISDDTPDGLCNNCRSVDALVEAVDEDFTRTLVVHGPDGQIRAYVPQGDGSYKQVADGHDRQ